MNATRALLIVVVVGLAAGCGSGVEERKFTSAELDKMAKDRRKAIADDKSLGDEAAIKKFCDAHPHKPTMLVGNNTPWVEVKPVGAGIPGYMLEVRKYDFSFTGRLKENVDMVKLERESIKVAAEFCEEAMTVLKPRGLKGISYHYYASVNNKSTEFEIFRATVTDASKLAAARGDAGPGSVFDPRGPRIGEIWKVELNGYPRIEYEKREKS